MSETGKGEYFGRDLEAMSFAKNYHQWIVDELATYIKGTIAEVGAGTGNVSELLLAEKPEALHAYEPSENMYPILNERFASCPNVTMFNSYFNQTPKSRPFDSIFYINVLEHIENDVEELKLARKCLDTGGHLLIFVPALPWLFSQLDKDVGHFRRYSKNSLSQTVLDANFEIVKVRYFDIAGIVPWYINFTLLGNTLSSSNVSAYDKYVIPVMRRLESIVAPPIGKNLLLIAKKVDNT